MASNESRLKILILLNIPSPYAVDYLNELGKYADVTAVFERESSSVRDDSWETWNAYDFNPIVLKGFKLGGKRADNVSTIRKKTGKIEEKISIGMTQADMAFSPQVIRHINRSYDRIIVCNPCTPTGIFACYYMNALHIPYGFQSEGAFPGSGRGLREWIKKSIFSKGKFFFSTALLEDEYYIMYGAKPEQIRRYPFSSIYEREILAEPLCAEEKKAIRERLNIPYNRVVVSVGRLIPNKGFDVFIEAMKGLPEDTGIYIIGGNPSDEYLAMRDRANKNIHFIGFQNKESITEYYKMADIFAINTRLETWGLFVNEAMAFGVPIITTNKCFAALAMMKNGKEGYIIDVDDGDTLRKKTMELLDDENMRRIMAINCVKKAHEYTIENEAKMIMEQL